MTDKTCIIIAGPTAVGKTKVAMDVARFFSSPIISADSRQCYRELNIGVAKPDEQELKEVHHFFINSHSIQDQLTAADFEKYALHAVNEIFQHHDIAIMTGGTGLYIKAFCDGLDEMPPVSDDIRNMVIENYKRFGIEWLNNMLVEHDPDFVHKGEMQNPQRMMRALEVMLGTGKSITAYKYGKKKHRNFNTIKIALELPREQLYERINQRVDEMMLCGLEGEARALLQYRSLNALQTVGYRELFDYFDGITTIEEAVEKIKQNTRHYAKRQMTWFKKDTEFVWLSPDSEKVLLHIKNRLKQ